MFDRTSILYDINKLKDKTVMLLGLGGVGSYTFEALVRSGIGRIIIVDGDKIDETNLNRQLIALKNNIGKYKTDEAILRAKMINEKIEIIPIKQFITKENIDILLKYKIDFLIDAIDTIDVKKELIKRCIASNTKFITVTGMGNKMDASLVKIKLLKDTCYDKIAKELRCYVKKEINQNVMTISSIEVPVKTSKIGSNSFVPATAGLLAASYAINILLEE